MRRPSLTLPTRIVAAFAAIASAACGGRGSAVAPGPAPASDSATVRTTAEGPARSPRRRPDLITREEIEASRATNVYDVVERLHPNWLHNRAPRTDYVVAFYNERELGSVALLRNVRVEGVESIRWYDAVVARARFGFGHEAGVIEVFGQ